MPDQRHVFSLYSYSLSLRDFMKNSFRDIYGFIGYFLPNPNGSYLMNPHPISAATDFKNTTSK